MNKLVAMAVGLLATAASSFAQTSDEAPNRILINQASGVEGYVMEHVDSITFAHVEGEVLAQAEILEIVSLDTFRVAVTKTPACQSYIIDIIPATIANRLENDVVAINYINRPTAQRFWDDFTNAELTGISLQANADYVLMTVGFDNYGIPAGVFRLPFSTPAPDIVGNPEVTCTIDETTLNSFTMTFVPNDDVLSYYCVAGEKGTMQQQYEMFGPMFGFANFGDLIKSWGIESTGTQTKTWDSMSPNTEYEVFVQCLDANGNYAPYQVFEVATNGLGGEGEASVSVEIGDYVMNDWNGEMKPSLYVSYTPNDQASCYRFGVYTAEEYDSDPEAIQEDIKSDPPMPTVYWFFYDPMTTDYQINPNTEIVVVAAAKNINKEWGPITEVRYTTPETLEGYTTAEAPAVSITKGRFNPYTLPETEKGKIPALKTPGIRLSPSK